MPRLPGECANWSMTGGVHSTMPSTTLIPPHRQRRRRRSRSPRCRNADHARTTTPTATSPPIQPEVRDVRLHAERARRTPRPGASRGRRRAPTTPRARTRTTTAPVGTGSTATSGGTRRTRASARRARPRSRGAMPGRRAAAPSTARAPSRRCRARRSTRTARTTSRRTASTPARARRSSAVPGWLPPFGPNGPMRPASPISGGWPLLMSRTRISVCAMSSSGYQCGRRSSTSATTSGNARTTSSAANSRRVRPRMRRAASLLSPERSPAGRSLRRQISSATSGVEATPGSTSSAGSTDPGVYEGTGTRKPVYGSSFSAHQTRSDRRLVMRSGRASRTRPGGRGTTRTTR